MRIFILVSILFFSTSFAHAQSVATQLNDQESIVFSPEFPSPKEPVTATINNYSSFLSGASIEWSIDGTVVPEAANHREFTFIAGEVGKPMTIRATLTPGSGMPRYISAVITPIYLDIVFEPQTHVPFFYEGRALPSIESTVNATALLDSGELLNEDLVYLWRVNQTVLEQGPIRGRNKVSFEMPRGNKAVVYLQINRPSGDPIARRAVYLPSVYPQMYFYEENALYGPSSKALTDGLFLTSNSVSIIAEPYNLDSRVFNAPDVSEWSIDNTETTSPSNNPYKIVIQKAGESSESNLSFHVRSLEQILQGAEGNIQVSY